MKLKTSLSITLAIAACLGSRQTVASSVSYHFNVDTSALAGNPNAPFALDFQLIDGDSLNNSSATISNFNFGGGNAVGVPTLYGGASGTLSSSVSLSDSDFFNELFQEFVLGGTLSFDVSVTSDAAVGTPDGFAFAIGSANDFGSSFFDVFAQIDLNTTEQFPHVSSGLDGVTVSAHVPEMASPANLPFGLASLGLFGFVVRQKRAHGIA